MKEKFEIKKYLFIKENENKIEIKIKEQIEKDEYGLFIWLSSIVLTTFLNENKNLFEKDSNFIEIGTYLLIY
jgi:hypothetical protein